jgi:hypothetical protein
MTQAISHDQAVPRARVAPKAPETERQGSGLVYIVPLIALAVAAGWAISKQKYYTPGSDLGYNLGLVGGIMMLLLLLYPLRKKFPALKSLGSLRHWFRIHMILGIGGPLLIILHSTFHIGSLNAAIALTSMLLVAGSGIVGRFVYTKIHHGLYGRRSTLQEQQTRLGMESADVKSKFHFAPKLEERLKKFEQNMLQPSGSALQRGFQFVFFPISVAWTYQAAHHELKVALKAVARARHWEAAKLRKRLALGDKLLHTYLSTVQEVAQFRIYERLFSLWHVLHVPFVYMLAASAIFHVIAVHMY